MKNALKNKKVYIIGGILLAVGLLISFGVFAISTIPALNAVTIFYSYLLYIFGFVYFLIGFIWYDVKVNNWRKKNKNWDGPVDEDEKEKAWKARWTFWLPAFAILIVALTFDFIAMGIGHYPFM